MKNKKKKSIKKKRMNEGIDEICTEYKDGVDKVIDTINATNTTNMIEERKKI